MKFNHLLLTGFISLCFLCCSQNSHNNFENNPAVDFARDVVRQSLQGINNSDSIRIHFFRDENLADNEAYRINVQQNSIDISAASQAGILYGSLKVREIIHGTARLPQNFNLHDAPVMHWRGISLQLMKLGKYNYAVTPGEFPFFYDKELWIKFMNFMMEQRFNYIILWNGHPFDYFVKFDAYPEAQSGLSDEQIEKNNAMLKWLIAEGNKRNIKIFFEFYNINTSVYYQEAHDLPDEISTPTAELAAYTKYSISKFIREFPQVGLFVTPGEGLQRQYSDAWINDVIFEAVKETGYAPVIFMRAWFFDLDHARKIVDHYPNLHFVRKFNVEMIADKQPDPENSDWAKLNGNFIVNIHLSANLEPFRWNPPSYIQEIVNNNIVSGANGIHLHPRKAWRWPYGSDIGIHLYQWQRDTLFFTAWSRYAWNPHRAKSVEQEYWLSLLSKRYGDKQAAKLFLESFESAADVLPALQRLIWLGYDNHTIVSAGATLLQLKDSRGIPFLSLKPTLRISDYLDSLKAAKTIQAETPIEFVEKKIAEAKQGLDQAGRALSYAKSNVTEANRIVSDARAVLYTAEFYWHKLQALRAWVLLETETEPEQNRQVFIQQMTESVNSFTKLVQLTARNYESTSDVSARHPLRLNKTPYHWKDLLPLYQQELKIYKEELSKKRSDDFYRPLLKGLAGIFFSEPAFVDAEEPFYAPTIDFNWDNDKEIGRHWSVRWFGFLQSPHTGKINIRILADRQASLSINKKVLRINGTETGRAVTTLNLEKGKFYPVEISYDHPGGQGGFVKLLWSRADQKEQVIPAGYLFHSQSQQSKLSLLEKLIEVMP